MSIELEPSQQLSFPRPLADGSSVTLKLRNPTDVTVAFKVKTTAPKQYCVRPNCGNIGPRETVEISVLLQPMKVEPPPGFKCKDKFLVQSVSVAPLEVDLQSTELWLAVEKSRKEEIIEHKLRCTYLDPVVPATNGTPGGLEAPPASDPARVPLPGDSPQLRNIHSVAESIYSAAPSSATSSTPGISNNIAVTSPLAPTPEVPDSRVSSNSNNNVLVPPPISTTPPASVPTQASPSSSHTNAAAATVATSPLPADPAPVLAAAPTPEKPTVTATASPAGGASLAATAATAAAAKPPAVAAPPLASASTVAALEAKITQLQAALTERDRQIAQMQVEATQLRQRSAKAAEAPQDLKPQVITRTVVNPSYYSPQLVVIIALVCFLIGVVVF